MQSSVVVIEPDGFTVGFLKKLFDGEGCRVHHEVDAAKGIERVRAVRPEITFIDLYLPDADGRRVLEDVRGLGIDTRVLMVSGRKNFGAVVACMRLGAMDFLEKPFSMEDLQLALRKVEDRIRLEREVRDLRGQVERGSAYSLLFSRCPSLRDVQSIVDQIADTDITVLIRGESGTGKDLLARAIWQCSSRRDGPFVKVNCAALPRELLESELFGYERGAFTGASHAKAGKFEFADKGVIFLDEISEMPIELQAKFLHVLQDGEVCRLGAKTPTPVDVRIVAATNQDLEQGIQARRFRGDLFYRLNVVNIVMPPLRERPDEVADLARAFHERFCEQYGRPGAPLPDDFLRLLTEYYWPGNIRELENYIRRIVVLGDVSGVEAEIRKARQADGGEGPDLIEPHEYEGATLKEISKRAIQRAERVVLQQVLEKTRWNRKKAAALLDISYKALLYKIKETGLE